MSVGISGLAIMRAKLLSNEDNKWMAWHSVTQLDERQELLDWQGYSSPYQLTSLTVNNDCGSHTYTLPEPFTAEMRLGRRAGGGNQPLFLINHWKSLSYFMALWYWLTVRGATVRSEVTDRVTTAKTACEECVCALNLIENIIKCTINLFMKNKIVFCDPT